MKCLLKGSVLLRNGSISECRLCHLKTEQRPFLSKHVSFDSIILFLIRSMQKSFELFGQVKISLIVQNDPIV